MTVINTVNRHSETYIRRADKFVSSGRITTFSIPSSSGLLRGLIYITVDSTKIILKVFVFENRTGKPSIILTKRNRAKKIIFCFSIPKKILVFF